MLRFLTAGESHGPRLTVIVDGVPAGLEFDAARDVDPDLRRRQGGHGRGRRQQIEDDHAEITGGVRGGRTIGSPLCLSVVNRDWDNWRGPMQVEAPGFTKKRVTRVRPGHADLAGMLKHGLDDARDVLERASARETAARVCAGAVARAILRTIGVTVHSCVIRIGDVAVDLPQLEGVSRSLHRAVSSRSDTPDSSSPTERSHGIDWAAVERSPVRCADSDASARMVAAIDAARAARDTLGGSAYVVAEHVPAGLGTYAQWDLRLDGRIAQALMSIPSVKGIEVGAAVWAASARGSAVHDEPRHEPGQGFVHRSNRQGGVTGGVSNGEDVWAIVHFKPISTLLAPLRTVDVATGEETNAHYERSDICVVPAGAVVAEAMLAFALAQAALEKFGGDSVAELCRSAEAHRRAAAELR